MPLELNGAQLGQFRDALAAAFPTWEAMRVFAESKSLVRGNLEGDVAKGPINTVAWELLKFLESDGRLQDCLTKALEAKPGNPELQRFAKSLGQPVVVEQFYENLSIDSYDLIEQQGAWERAFSLSLELGLLIFLVRDAELEVLDPMVRRLYVSLSRFDIAGAFGPATVTLQATLSSPEQSLKRVIQHASMLKKQPVLVKVLADKAQPHVVTDFLARVHATFAGPLTNQLVLLMNVAVNLPTPQCDHIELPAWKYEEIHINSWVKSIGSRAGWSTGLKRALKDYLCNDPGGGAGCAPSVGELYDRLRLAVEHLRDSPDEATLLNRLQGSA